MEKFVVDATPRGQTMPLSVDLTAGANALVPVTNDPQQAQAHEGTALTCLKRSLAFDKSMYEAVRNKGKLDEHSWLPTLKVIGGCATAGLVLAGGIAGEVFFRNGSPGPFIVGALATAAVGIPSAFKLASIADKRHTTAVVPESKAKPFVEAYVAGDPLTKRLTAFAASRWHRRLEEREVGGVFVRRQLKEVADAVPPHDPKIAKIASAIEAIAVSLRGEHGAPLKALGSDALRKIENAVTELEGDNRREVSAFLIEVLYKDERPRIPVYDQGASQRLLQTLASLQPFKGLSSTELATPGEKASLDH